MKSIYFLFILTISFSYSQSKMYDVLVNKSETKILYDRVFGVSDAPNARKTQITANYYLQLYSEMQRADFLNRLPKLEKLRTNASKGFTQNQVPLSLLIADFEKINKNSFENGDLKLNSNNLISAKTNANNLFEKYSINILAPLLSKSQTKEVTFVLNEDMFFNTTNKIVESISIEANNNENWIVVSKNKPFTIRFENNGNQIINCKIKFTNGQSIFQSFQIEIDNQNETVANKNMLINTVNATIPFQGYDETQGFLGQGEYELFLDTTNGVLDKPIFLIDGFDPGNGRNIASIYQLLNYNSGSNLADYLRAQGFDIVILNFPTYTRPNTTVSVDGGADYIQRNAFVLVELINQINAQKVGTEKNVVIGPSMGGLIARYALRYMEMNSLAHDTRLYISFDAPHLGANVPIGFQHALNYLAFGPLNYTEFQPIVNSYLKSPSSRQMLIDQFEGHLQTSSQYEFNTAIVLPTGKPGFRTVFQNELNTMGFPQTTRNVSISNGASNGTMIGTPSMSIMSHTFNTASDQRAIIDLKFTPATNQTTEVSKFIGQYSLFNNWITIYDSRANSKAPTYTDGLDTAPGGRYDMYSLENAFQSSALLTEFFDNLLTQYFCFIPSLSSMAITNTNNLYTPINTTSNSPFVAYSIPTVNENHVTLTQTNATFAINEIMNPPLTNNSFLFQNFNVGNPVENTIVIHSNNIIKNATIKVVDMLGKTIYDKVQNISQGETTIDFAVSSGIYILKVDDGNSRISKKLIKQ
jgi:pimeloyl-ACP methyl ester carboxylesterase